MEKTVMVFRLPRWMKVPLPEGKNYTRVKQLIQKQNLNTICSSGNCPNKGECWNAGTASFMIMGEKCTRNCRFCYVENLETVRRLTPSIRNNAYYERSLQVIRMISESGLVAKSGIMLGLGESADEVMETLADLRKYGCHVVTIGQYLQPATHLKKVHEFVKPEVFEKYRKSGL